MIFGSRSPYEFCNLVTGSTKVSLLDNPVCEFFKNGLAMPVMVFAKTPSCQNILVPDHSLMQDEYLAFKL